MTLLPLRKKKPAKRTLPIKKTPRKLKGLFAKINIKEHNNKYIKMLIL